MKKIFPLLLLVACTKGFGQAPTPSQQKLLLAKIDTVVTSYINFSSFLLPGKNTVTDVAVSNFRSLFWPGVNIPNEMVPAYFYGDTVLCDRMVTGTVDEYTSAISKNFTDGITVRVLYTDINLDNVAGKAVKVLIIKHVEGFTKDGLNLQNQDTLVLKLGISDDYSQVRISGEDVLGYAFTSSNDRDHDFIADSKDPCPDLRDVHRMASTGKATGCTTDWEQVYLDQYAARVKLLTDSIRKVFDSANESTSRQSSYTAGIAHYINLINTPPHVWIEGGVHAGIVTSSLSNSKNIAPGQLYLNPTFSGSAAFGGDIKLAYFFGKTAGFGISAGAAYSSFSGKLTNSGYMSSFLVSGGDGNSARQQVPYTQVVSMTNPNNSIVENVTLSQLSIPITLVYKGKFSDNFGFQVEAGALYNLQYSGSMGSVNNAVFDFGAIYNYQTNSRWFPGTGNTNQSQAFEITEDFARQKYSASTLAQQQAYLTMMGSNANGSYPVGANFNAASAFQTNKSATFNSGSLGFILRSGVSYYFSPVFTLSALVYFESSNFTNSNNASYQLVGPLNTSISGTTTTHQISTYNTLLNSISTMNNTQIGLRVSVAHALFYNVDKWKANRDDLQKSLNVEHSKYKVIHTDLMDLQERLDYLRKHKPVF